MDGIHQFRWDRQSSQDVQELAMVNGIKRLLHIKKGHKQGLLGVMSMVTLEEQ